MGFSTLADLEAAASRTVAPAIWAYIQGGAGEEWALRCNRDAFRRRTLRPRGLNGRSSVRLSARILGSAVKAPFFPAPMAYQGSIHPDGELATARATAAAGLLGVYSTLSTRSLEEIAGASGTSPRWFQLYLQPEFDRSAELARRAEQAGYSAVVLTIDAPILAVRDRQTQHGFAIDATLPLGNGPGVVPPSRAAQPAGEGYMLRDDAAASWEVLDRLRSVTSLPIVVKGVLSAPDARLAVEHGARGILVSNHGGRQLDAAPASLEALPEVVQAVGHHAEVYLDGGVRRASDVLTALAMGARAVGIGRPVLWALACGGAEGVRRLYELLTQELVTLMALLGRGDLAEVDEPLLGPLRW